MGGLGAAALRDQLRHQFHRPRRGGTHLEKDSRFAGARLGWDWMEQFNAGTTFDNKFASNVNLADPGDYSICTTSALTVAIASRVSLKVSLQWRDENEPALESDLDVIALVELINPDGIPSSGDEFFLGKRRHPAGRSSCTRVCGRAEGQAGYHLPDGACPEVLAA